MEFLELQLVYGSFSMAHVFHFLRCKASASMGNGSTRNPAGGFSQSFGISSLCLVD